MSSGSTFQWSSCCDGWHGACGPQCGLNCFLTVICSPLSELSSQPSCLPSLESVRQVAKLNAVSGSGDTPEFCLMDALWERGRRWSLGCPVPGSSPPRAAAWAHPPEVCPSHLLSPETSPSLSKHNSCGFFNTQQGWEKHTASYVQWLRNHFLLYKCA